MNTHSSLPLPLSPTVIIDRDGTLIVDKHYLHDPSQVELLPGVVPALLLLQKLHAHVFVATNQSGIGRGYYTETDMHAVHAKIDTLLAKHSITIQGYYFCPHPPDTQCFCRKPNQGMLEKIQTQHCLSPQSSFVIGDKACDILFGHRANMRTILVRTGYGKQTEMLNTCTPSFIAENLYDASHWITTQLLQ